MDSEEGTAFGCLSGMVPCYKDCCHRGLQFCNDFEKRCQHCKTRQIFCNNQSLLPPACDVYCLKQETSQCSDTHGMVHPAYFWSTCILTALLLACVIYITTQLFRRGRQESRGEKIRNQSSSSHHSECSSESLLPDKQDSEVASREITADLSNRESQLPPLVDSAPFTGPQARKPSASPPAFQLDTACRDTPPTDLLTPPPSPPTAHLTPNDDTKVKGIAVSTTPASSSKLREAPPLLGRETSLNMIQTISCHGEEKREDSAAYADSTKEADFCDNSCNNRNYPCRGKQQCHDPRLDNISPTSDGDHAVSVHTGHSCP